jgi:dihydrofolate reductase
MNCIVYIATEEGGLDGLNAVPHPTNDDYGRVDFNHRIDAVLMGRKTFDIVMSFDGWLYERIMGG